MRHRIATALLIGLGMLSATAGAQEQGYNEDSIRPSKVPGAIRDRAAKEAPGARFSAIYTDSEKGYRLVGQKADGSWVSVQFNRSGELYRIWNWKVIPMAKAPKAVARALQAALRQPKAAQPGSGDLTGFVPARLWLVDEFTTFRGKEEKATFYEYLGYSAKVGTKAVRIGPAGEFLGIKDPLLNPSKLRRQSFAAGVVPTMLRQKLTALVPTFRPTRLVREGDPPSAISANFLVDGRDRRGRKYIFFGALPAHLFRYDEEIDAKEVPAAVLAAVRREADSDSNRAGFRPVEAWRRNWVPREPDSAYGGPFDGQTGYMLYGDDVHGRPIQFEYQPDGKVMPGADSREEWEVGTPSILLGERVRPSGFAVIAARFGRIGWIDATDYARAGVDTFMLKSGIGGVVPDPTYGVKKAMALLYSVDGRVGLTVQPEGEMPLPPKAEPDSLVEAPSTGFAVLAARYGVGETWIDATEAVKKGVSGGRLDLPLADLRLPDPVQGELKTLVIAYAEDGLVGLHHFHDDHRVVLPWALPSANSSALEARKFEYPAKVSTVAFGPEGRLAAGVEDGTIRLIDAEAGAEARKLDGHGAGWVSVAISPRGNLVLSGGADRMLRLWDARSGKARAIFRGHEGPIRRVALSPNGKLAASSSDDKTLRIWDAGSGRELRKLEGHGSTIDALAFAPDGRSLVSTSWDQTLRVWDASTGRELRQYRGDGGALGAFGLTRDGKSAFVGTDNRTVRRVDLATARELAQFPTQAEAGLGTMPTPDGRRFLAADGTSALLWDVEKNLPALRLERHTSRIRGIAVAPDGRKAATAGDDNTLRIWDIP